MLTVQPKLTSTSFQGGHQPRKFSAMMNYIYAKLSKERIDSFESTGSIVITTTMPDGKEVSGMANFLGGKYAGLVMEEGSEHLKASFMKTTLDKYIKKISSKRQLNKINKTI
uniref:hypothetical protein n=1 Tax=Candidatus Scatousia sp. TaxID=3085663 RepID=UPI004029914C